MSERLRLEPLRIDHAREMAVVLADTSLYEYTGGEPPSLASLTRRYTAQVAGSGDDNEQWLNWIVRLVPSDTAIGFVQATIEHTGAEVAWTIGVEWQGKGYASEAAAAMHTLLTDHGVTSISAWIHPGHAASHGVARSLGLEVTTETDEDGEQRWTT